MSKLHIQLIKAFLSPRGFFNWMPEPYTMKFSCERALHHEPMLPNLLDVKVCLKSRTINCKSAEWHSILCRLLTLSAMLRRHEQSLTLYTQNLDTTGLNCHLFISKNSQVRSLAAPPSQFLRCGSGQGGFALCVACKGCLAGRRYCLCPRRGSRELGS